MLRRFLVHLRGQWAGYLALFLVVMGGSAYALAGHNSVKSDDIAPHQVKAGDLAPLRWHAVKPAAGDDLTPPCTDSPGHFCWIPLSGIQWTNFGDPYRSAAYAKDGLGMVHLRGLVKQSPTYGWSEVSPLELAILELPPAYRPAKTEVLHSVGATEGTGDPEFSAARIDVGADGLVEVVIRCHKTNVGESTACTGGSNGGYVSLSGLDFSAH